MANTQKASKKSKEKAPRPQAERLRLVEPAEQNEPGEPGSIEQQLDMVEGAGPRGDEVLRHKGRSFDEKSDPNRVEELNEDSMLLNYHQDMSDTNREGDEMSGDEHSSGLQGGDSELEDQPTFNEGLPGDETQKENDGGKGREGELPFSRTRSPT